MVLHRDVADGVHRVGEHYVNWYLVEDGGRLTVVDAGLPASWASLLGTLGEIGRAPADVGALVLTHAHFDHIGFAERARALLGIPVWVHENLGYSPTLVEIGVHRSSCGNVLGSWCIK